MRICLLCWNKLFAANSAKSLYVDDDFSLAVEDLLCIIGSGRCVHCQQDSNKILCGVFEEISLAEDLESAGAKKQSQRCLHQQEYDSLLHAIRVARLNLSANADTRSLIDDCYDDFGDHPDNQPET